MENVEIPEVTKVSSKGQLVIPKECRDKMGLAEGTLLSVAVVRGMLVFRKIDSRLNEKELKLLKELKEAWTEFEKGECKSMSKEDFLGNLAKW